MIRGVFDEEWFAACREKRLLGLLDREMVETEPKWLNYEFEQAQVKIDIGDMILDMVVNDTVKMLMEASKRNLDDHPLLQQVDRLFAGESREMEMEKELSARDSSELEMNSRFEDNDEEQQLADEALLKLQ